LRQSPSRKDGDIFQVFIPDADIEGFELQGVLSPAELLYVE
jgi:hypothetical protein